MHNKTNIRTYLSLVQFAICTKLHQNKKIVFMQFNQSLLVQNSICTCKNNSLNMLLRELYYSHKKLRGAKVQNVYRVLALLH